MVTLSVLFFCLLFGISHGCSCRSYLISENGLSNQNLISSMNITVADLRCDGNGVMVCKDSCYNAYDNLSQQGKICKKYPGKDVRVADWMCQELKRNINNGRIGVFSQSCGSDLMDTGFRFVENLFCRDGHALYC